MIPTASDLPTDQRGQALADSWSDRHREQVERLEAADMELFHDEIQAFVDDWQGRDHSAIDENVMRLLTGGDPERGLSDWLDGGEDLGVESIRKLTLEQLEEMLGSTDGRFPTFRKHVAKEWKDYEDEKDVEILGKTTVFTLRHHQLVAIVAILQRAVNPPPGALSRWPPKQPNVTDASPLALREHWGSLPGHWLADTVGLGKTWTGAGLIAAYMNLYTFSTGGGEGRPMPRILGTEKFKFGPCDEIPNAAHIIVVPGSLLSQWGDQLKRVYRSNAVAIKVIRPAKKHWEKDMEVSPNVAPVNTIFVIGLTVGKRGVTFTVC